MLGTQRLQLEAKVREVDSTLEDHKETLTIGVKSIQKQEKTLGERFEDISGRIQAALGGRPQAG